MNPDKDRVDSKLQDAVARLFDGELDDEEFAALCDRLREDPVARQAYFAAASLETSLDHVFTPPLSRSGPGHYGQAAALRKQAKWAIGIAAAAAVVIASILWVIQTQQAKPGTVTLRMCDNANWSVKGPTGPSGSTLRPGASILIEKGVAELQLPDQVRAVIEAPAAVTLVDERTLQMDHGSGFFEVSSVEGRGFTVVTPHQRIVDLGTAFGVNARTGREGVELHVFKGRVRVDDPEGRAGDIIEANRAVLLDGPKVKRDLQNPPTTFQRTLPPKVETIFQEDFESGLSPEKDYSVLIEPLAIRDLDGNRFPGIDNNKSWNFTTGLAFAHTVPVQNPGFEADGQQRNKGASIAHWHKQLEGWGWGADAQRNNLFPTEGEFFGRVFRSHVLLQQLDETITAGTTYVLTVDVGLTSPSRAVLQLLGSDAGEGAPLAERTVSIKNGGWQRNQSLIYTATAADATGQKLGIALKGDPGSPLIFAAFDRVRLGKVGYTNGETLPEGFTSAPTIPASNFDPNDPENPTAGSDEDTPPMITALHPADDAAEVVPGSTLTMAFNKPVKLGTGRIFLRNITDWSVAEIAVGGPRTSVEGRFLTITPPSDLNDGERSMGRIHGWECNAWAGVFNPAGKGLLYDHPRLNDDGRSKGELDSMRGPVIATFESPRAGSWIRRDLGTIFANTRYTVSAAIGVRSDPTSRFAGYTIRLTSGETILGELREDTPPGPPNSMPTVAFSLDSSNLPQGIQPGDPLTLTIAPNNDSQVQEAPAYLDVDNIRVTTTTD